MIASAVNPNDATTAAPTFYCGSSLSGAIWRKRWLPGSPPSFPPLCVRGQRCFPDAAVPEPVKINETGIGHIVCMTASCWLIQAAPGIDGGVGLCRNRLGLAV